MNRNKPALSAEFVSPGHHGGPVSRQTIALGALVVTVLLGKKAADVLGWDRDVTVALVAVLAVVGALAGALYHPVARFWWRGTLAGIMVAGGAFLAHMMYARVRPEAWSLEFAVIAALGSVPGVLLYAALMRGEVVAPGEDRRRSVKAAGGGID
jgi:ABC-type xylose transport system permease subunit